MFVIHTHVSMADMSQVTDEEAGCVANALVWTLKERQMLQQCGHILPLFHVPFIALAKNLHNIEPKHTLSFICSSSVHLGRCHTDAHPHKHKVEQDYIQYCTSSHWLTQQRHIFLLLFWMVHDEFCQPPCEKLRHAVQVIQNGSAYEK